MILNYIKIAFRNITRYKIFSFINIAGLAVSIALCLLIFIWIQDETSYDRFHENKDHIYRIISQNIDEIREAKAVGSPSPVGPAMVEQFPEITNFTRLQSGWSGWHFHYKDKTFMKERLACADRSFFQIFRFPFIKGDPETALKDRYSIVLTRTMAEKIFGDEEPMGKIIKKGETDMMVTGIIEDIPKNSHIQFDYIFPIVNMTRWRESSLDSWEYTQFATYLELAHHADIQQINRKIKNFTQKYDPDSKIELSLQAMSDIHLKSVDINSWMIVYPNPGNLTYLYIFTAIAICILFLACINYMNLSTARSLLRSKEIGVRKVSGAYRNNLVFQFLGEAVIISFFSGVLAVFLAELFLPLFNSLSGKQLALPIFQSSQLLWSTFVIIIITGLLAGSYPAFYLSSLQPTKTLHKFINPLAGHSGSLRRILVVTQFTITIILIFCTIVFYQQMSFIQNKDLGFNSNNIVYFASYGKYDGNYETCRNALLQNPIITEVCRAFPPGRGYRGSADVIWPGKDPTAKVMFFTEFVDYDYLSTFRMTMSEGRFYSRQYGTDSENYVLNQAAIRAMGLSDPIGKEFEHNGQSGTIIGVINDFHGGSLHHAIRPKVLKLSDDNFFICVRFQTGLMRGALDFLEQKWNEYVPDHPFRYNLLNESIDNFYKTERRILAIVQYFAILAIIIACLGLFGLASFLAEKRTKEIGIRKVLGAKISGIIMLFGKEFSILVTIAMLIACPLGWWIMNNWLENFAYKIDMTILTLIITGLTTFIITIIAISYQSLKVALSNPVEALRYE